MKVALAQINTIVGDLSGNAAKIRDAYDRAVVAGADLVLTPELAIAGYPPRDLLAKKRFVADNLRTLDELALHVGQAVLIVGYVDISPSRPGREYFNAAAVIQHGNIVARRFKSLLPSYDVFDEERYFEPAKENRVVEIDGRRIGVTICEDIWSEDYLRTPLYTRDPIAELVARDAPLDLIVNLSASPFYVRKTAVRRDLLRHRAIEYRVPVAYCNLIGGNDELIFDGQSLVFDATGQVLAQGKAFVEDLVLVDTSAPHFARNQPVDDVNETATLHDALVLGLRDYAEKCGFKSVVLGLSGGIDSAVTACLAVEAFGKQNVMGVSMPSQYSSPGSVDDARELARNLDIRWERIPIQPLFEQFQVALKELFAGRKPDTTEENLQARIRGNVLMAISNKFGHMLLTTGNKSEMAVGYCTLYGDMAGGLAVIADVPKTKVYELAHYINRRSRAIPESSITKPPSAELRPNQTDQDSLPPYDVLDVILKRYVEDHQSAAEIIAATTFDEKTVRDIIRKIDLNEYKRKQAPPSLRVTTKAFGIGRRVPIAQRYVER